MGDSSALLLLLLDSRAPAGGHAHSGGMEPAVDAGWVQDLVDVEQFCRGRLRTGGRVAAAFAAAACRLGAGPAAAQPAGVGAAARPTLGWDGLDAEYAARLPSEALRAASRAQGSGLRRMARAMLGTDLPLGHHPLVLGAAVAHAGGTPELAARAAALGSITAPATAAVRLLGLDPLATQGMLARLATLVDACAHDAATARTLPADSAPALDLLADVHTVSEVRLFAS